MNKKMPRLVAALGAVATIAFLITPAAAQTSEAKEKPPMYSYVGNWSIPRAQWAEMDKNTASSQKILDKALSSGTLVGYGNDTNLVHVIDGPTHDEWWSALSMAGIINVLEQFYQSGTTTAPVLAGAGKHWDEIYVSRNYNWHAGSYKNVYTHVSSYKLKPDSPDDAVERLSSNVMVPFFEKLLGDGAIHEYEIDTEAIHTDTPGTFWVLYIAANAEGLDKVNSALEQTLKTNPLMGQAFGSMVDFTAHRDYLMRTNVTFK
ncbi:MAG: hypothetical protein JO159_19720 [Acidobacteria bacterium]|nr:hypothetical protein [Acidobacteriota bacterium]MBV9623318.1 hypothetical protein [Acidobacteriota bacterium]